MEPKPRPEIRLKLAPEILASIEALRLATLDLNALIEREAQRRPTVAIEKPSPTMKDPHRLDRVVGWGVLIFLLILATPWVVDRVEDVSVGKPSRGLTLMEPIFGLFIGLAAMRATTGKNRPLVRGVVIVLGTATLISMLAFSAIHF